MIAERPAPLADMLRLAITIADDQARLLIEAGCEQSRDFHNDTWFDTSQATQADPLSQQRVVIAIDYLYLRQRIRRHADSPRLIAFNF